MKNCTSTRGDYTCLEVQFIFSRMGTKLPEDIDGLVQYDETTKPNDWYEAEQWNAEKCYKAIRSDPASKSFLRTIIDNVCKTLPWDNTLSARDNFLNQLNSFKAS